ncbi:Eco57I restriction-modification methylase domain-containing protein [Acinetobacter schindleri]|uniref:Eco57I restriction-modification methylase domain-containing protein n=1 Tax=Acinetobacter schindleri TaxID=108981 RepID=UPI0028A0AB25|nr:N-6 DNA methylase [Acinetobacter schindleri]
MKLENLNSLVEYTADINCVNRLIVTVFLKNNKIIKVKNNFISNFIISENDEDYIFYESIKDKLDVYTFDDLIKAFEYIISPIDKVVTGAIYTPEFIRGYILDSVINDDNIRENVFKICDPACGCGGFLYSAVLILKKINPELSYNEIYKDYIFGLDLKEYSVERTKILLTLLAICNEEDDDFFDFNLFAGNALNFNWFEKLGSSFDGFDIVVGNPPYVASRNIEEDTLNLLKKWKVCSTGHPDLYIPFFEIGMSIVKEGGCLGFITMNTFFKSLNGRALRKYFDEKKYKFSITDFGSVQIFSSRNTYTCICIIEKVSSKEIFYRKVSKIEDVKKIKFNNILYDDLKSVEGWNLDNNNLINKIETIGKPLKSIYKINTGIATLKNNIYIIDPVSEDEENYILSCGLKVEKGICVNIFNPNKLIERSCIEDLKKKIIFPYFYQNDIAKIIAENDLKVKFPNAYSYLLQNKKELNTRDKGNNNYEEWYAYGRYQGMVKSKYKLFFPHIAPKTPNFIISEEEDLLFHNGLAILSNDKESLKILKVLMSSRLFWFYIVSTSKPYTSGYFSLSNNYIKSFGIYPFNEEQKKFLLSEKDSNNLNKFIEELYGVSLDFNI